MKVTLKSDKSLKRYAAFNEKGKGLFLSGDGSAAGPMQAVLMAAAGCSSIDIVMILEKMKQPLTDIQVEVDGKRRDKVPKIYTEIHLHYKLYGDLNEKKVKKAIDLSLGKYCSVSKMLEKSATITSSFEIILS